MSLSVLDPGVYVPPGVFPAEAYPAFPSIPRLFREMTITEKIDGDNGLIQIANDCVSIRAGSRTRWLTPEDDNKGFARWVEANKADLLSLGPGVHAGEWWGAGLQRRYDMKEKRFSLFNVSFWGPGGKSEDKKPACCAVVPVLYRGPFSEAKIREVLADLERTGSVAAPGFMRPEGVIVWHAASHQMYKYTVGGDGHKGQKEAS